MITCSKVQIICIWSGHCHPKTLSSLALLKTQKWHTRVDLEKMLLNECYCFLLFVALQVMIEMASLYTSKTFGHQEMKFW